MATRHEIRICEFILLYQRGFYEEDFDEQEKIFLDELVKEDPLSDEERQKVIDTIDEVLRVLPEIDERISSASKGWKLKRIAKAELAILRLGVYEILYDDEVPVPVAIDEAVELARDYGREEGYSFVNGVLGTIAKNGG